MVPIRRNTLFTCKEAIASTFCFFASGRARPFDLDITQPEFAEAAGLGLSTIVDFEKSRRDVSRAAVHALQKALEKAGVRFIGKDGGGPGVRLLS